MKERIKALKGMSDILPGEVEKWQWVENTARALFRQYGYTEIRTPIVEETALFTRSIGEETDIVQKQMYTFKDRGERDVALRPEGTASVARAYIENDLTRELPLCRLYYIGPMFRSERPQAGRKRQFHQIGVEAIGSASPYQDAEVILLMMKLISSCGLGDAKLKLNSLGCEKDKKAFEQVLRQALKTKTNSLCEDCAKRYKTNILRIFDCKNDACKDILRSAPSILEHICAGCRRHFENVKKALELVNISYSVTPGLVRGLDYYTGTVFEVTHKNLGSQDAVAAGGRYDNLIGEIGQAAVPACGFAIGTDRLLLAAQGGIPAKEEDVEVFLILLGEEAQKRGFALLNELRNNGIRAQADLDGKSLKSQMRLADRIKAKKVLILGEDELKKGVVTLRDMETKEQKEINIKDVADAHLW